MQGLQKLQLGSFESDEERLSSFLLFCDADLAWQFSTDRSMACVTASGRSEKTLLWRN